MPTSFSQWFSRRRLNALLSSLVLLATIPSLALAQTSVLQGGPFTPGHVPTYSLSGSSGQPIVIDSGPAGGNTTGQGLGELNITSQCASPPCASTGTGQGSAHVQIQDAPSTNATGYHFLSFDANAAGGGLINYGAAGGASPLPLTLKVNGTPYAFPFAISGIVGPGTSVVNDVACWNNTVGTLLKDCGAFPSVGGTSGQIQYNNAGAFGGFTLGGDATVNTGTGALTVTKIGGQTISLAGTLTTAGAFTTSGANALTLVTTTTTNVTMPASGTGVLSTLAGAEAFTNKTYNGNTWTAGTGTLTIAAGKTATISNTLTLTATDGSMLAIGTGGTLGTAAYTTSLQGTQITNALGGNVSLSNTSNYFDGPVVAQGATGTWFVSGTATLTSSGQDIFFCKLWDGTTVIASSATAMVNVNDATTIALSGYLATPAGNLRISCRDTTSTSGSIVYNSTSLSKDSVISAFRVQ